MRKQYHFRKEGKDVLIWDVEKLIELSLVLPVVDIPLTSIKEYQENYWYQYEGDTPTCESVAMHARIISECDLNFPIILDSEGRVMDGMHRVCKAHLEGHQTIKARQFSYTPNPNYKNVSAENLDYG